MLLLFVSSIITILTAQKSLSQSLLFPQPYYGDLEIKEHLKMLCSQSERKAKIYVVDNFIFKGLSQLNITRKSYDEPSPFHTFLRRLNCRHTHLPHIHLNKLIEKYKLKNNIFYFQHRQIRLFVFDFSPYYLFDQQIKFDSVLKNLEKFYLSCLSCLPLVALFDDGISFETLLKSVQRSNYHLDSQFRATLVVSNFPQVLHIHPVLDGCYSYPGLFVPKNYQDFEKLKTPFDECNLNGSTLKVLVNHAPPFCSLIRYGEEDDLVADYSMEIQFLKLLEERYNFRAELSDGHQSPYMLLDDMWTGIETKILKGAVDFSLCDVSFTTSRLKVLDFTYFTYFNEVTWVSQSPSLVYHDLIFFAKFALLIWMVICAAFGLLFFLFRYLKVEKNPISSYDLFTNIWGIYLRQCMTL